MAAMAELKPEQDKEELLHLLLFGFKVAAWQMDLERTPRQVDLL